jgi:uncharacterized DUF497 family protein
MLFGAEIQWSEEKNRKLKAERGLAFEDVIAAIENGRLLADIEHYQAARKDRQRILVVGIGGYACAVPYVADGRKVFLKTIFRSRALMTKYAVKK